MLIFTLSYTQPTPTNSTSDEGLPTAAIVMIGVGAYLVLVMICLVIRQCLKVSVDKMLFITMYITDKTSPLVNPLSPMSDQYQISLCNSNALYNRVVMRIKDMITRDEFT